VCSRLRLASTAWTIFLRWLPAAFGSVPGAALVYFVAITTLCRWPCINSPRKDSLVPLVYRLAVSMKLPPASRKASYTFRASSFAAPQPQSSPKVIVPSAASETRSPLLPKSLYLICISFKFLAIVEKQFLLLARRHKHSFKMFPVVAEKRMLLCSSAERFRRFQTPARRDC